LAPGAQEGSDLGHDIANDSPDASARLAGRLAHFVFADNSSTSFNEASRVSSIGDFALSTLPSAGVADSSQHDLFKSDPPPSAADQAVQDSVRGIYSLWKVSGGGRSEEEFLRLVKLSLG
jgi:hypothetical protein